MRVVKIYSDSSRVKLILVRIALCTLDGRELLSTALGISVLATKYQHLDSALLDSFCEGAQGDRSIFHFHLNPEQDLPIFSAV